MIVIIFLVISFKFKQIKISALFEIEELIEFYLIIWTSLIFQIIDIKNVMEIN